MIVAPLPPSGSPPLLPPQQVPTMLPPTVSPLPSMQVPPPAGPPPAGPPPPGPPPLLSPPPPPLPTISLTSPTDLGIIYPPVDVRGIIDKTAQFVAKNGADFEQRVLRDQSGGQKFAFLLDGNPYKAYYRMKVQEFQTGEVNESSVKQIPKVIQEMKQKEEEKKQKKDQLLSLTQYGTVLADGAGFGSHNLLAIEDEKEPDPPDPDIYSVSHPFAAPVDVDVMKLTAQFVARNGQKFLAGLSQRERGNSQFDFLKPTHPLFQYFTSLVDAYTRCLLPSKATIEKLKVLARMTASGADGKQKSDNVDKRDSVENSGEIDNDGSVNRSSNDESIKRNKNSSESRPLTQILERCYKRFLWESYEQTRRQLKEKKEEAERAQMQNVDWHDFLVVAVIDFTEEDEKLPLAPLLDPQSLHRPKMLPPLESAAMISDGSNINSIGTDGKARDINKSLQEDLRGIGSLEAEPSKKGDRNGETDMDMQDDMDMDDETAENNVPLPETLQPPAPPGLPKGITSVPKLDNYTNTNNTFSVSNGMGLVQSETGVQQAPIIIRKDYTRESKRRERAGDTKSEFQKCPITGQLIRSTEMSNHLRILLLDPKWKDQKDRLMAKARKETAFASETDFEANLANFVIKRPDLFGTVEDEILEHAANESVGVESSVAPPPTVYAMHMVGGYPVSMTMQPPIIPPPSALSNPWLQHQLPPPPLPMDIIPSPQIHEIPPGTTEDEVNEAKRQKTYQ